MSPPPGPSPARPSPAGSRWAILGSAAALVLAALLAYQNSFSGPFIFDDTMAITDNPTIRDLGRIGEVLSPPTAGSAGSRPLVNLSLALNYAVSGLDPWSYHALNLAIHILAGLTLFGIVRRTLVLKGERRRSAKREDGEAKPSPVGTATAGALWATEAAKAKGGSPESDVDRSPTLWAFAIALLWTVHPLVTESVTFVIQRTESLMGLFYLLTLYCFIRCVESENAQGRRPLSPSAFRLPPFWSGLCFLSCLFGMASKEVMVSAPLVVLLYDRTFVAGTFRAAWEKRRGLYLALAATWLPLGYLVLANGSRGGAAGFGTGIPWWTYALTQGHAIPHYLRLAAWPYPLVLDYGDWVVAGFWAALPGVIGVLALLAGTVIALRRRPALGFVGAWFFAILAPSSSVIPLATQTIAEHRMYLPLAAPIVLAVLGLAAWLGRRAFPLLLGAALVLGFLTSLRNEDYRSSVAIWRDTLAHNPNSSRVQNNLAVALAEQPGGQADAIAHYEAALRLHPDSIEAHNNLANALARLPGRQADAIGHYEAALRLNPKYVEAHYNLAATLAEIPGRETEAIEHYDAAIRLRPDYVEAHNNLANLLARMPGGQAEAIAHYEAVLLLKPDAIEAHNNLANLLARTPGRQAEAIAHYEAVLRLRPEASEAQNNLANTLVGMPGRQAEALAHYEAAVRLKPDYLEAHYNLAMAYAAMGRFDDSIRQLEIVLTLNPGLGDARRILEKLQAMRRGPP